MSSYSQQQQDPSKKTALSTDVFIDDWNNDDDLMDIYYAEQDEIHETQVQKRPRSDQEEEEKKIPDYLMVKNTTFEQMIRTVTSDGTNSINIETIRQIAILLHQCAIIDLEKPLWFTFLKSDTGILTTADQMGPTYCPEKLRLMLTSMKNTLMDAGMIDTNDFSLVRTHLNQLDNQHQQLQMILVTKTKSIDNYSTKVEPILRTFIQQNLQALQMENEYEIALMEYEYVSQQQFRLALQKQNLTDEQIQFILRLGQRKYKQENSRQEVSFLQEHIEQNKLLDSLQSVQIHHPYYIEFIRDQAIQQQLSERHKKIIKQYQNEMMKSFRHIAEIYMVETQKLFDKDMKELWQKQHFNSVVMNLIERHFVYITETIQSIYKYKRFQSFGKISKN